jgi:hypothetical protein
MATGRGQLAQDHTRHGPRAAGIEDTAASMPKDRREKKFLEELLTLLRLSLILRIRKSGGR